jgi:hypothetical protein
MVTTIFAGMAWLAALLPAMGDTARPTLIVRTYDTIGVAPDELRTARAAARTILSDGMIDLVWRDCEIGRSDSPCGAHVQRDELIVRLVAAPQRAGDDVLGYSLVDVRERAGSLATIFHDRVETMAARAHVEPGSLLGRTIVHEIGHMLLGPDHSPAGLMRAHWYDDELQRDVETDWVLGPRDAMRMRFALLRRSMPFGTPAVLIAGVAR